MTFLYNGDYGASEAVQSSPFFEHTSRGIDTPEYIQKTLLLHSTMYACAVRYGVAALKDLAQGRFRSWAYDTRALKDLPTLIAHVFTTTPPNDRGLRDVVRDICALCIDEVTTNPL